VRAFIVAFAIGSFVAGTTLMSQAEPPAPGRLVDVGGWRMHLHCAGDARVGRPTVILEAGSSGFSID
jgi:hypothetical protein